MTTPELTVSALADWLRKQEPGTRYDFKSPTDCLNCRFLRAAGLPVESVGIIYWNGTDGTASRIPEGFDGVARMKPWTYGAALSRAEAILARGGE